MSVLEDLKAIMKDIFLNLHFPVCVCAAFTKREAELVYITKQSRNEEKYHGRVNECIAL